MGGRGDEVLARPLDLSQLGLHFVEGARELAQLVLGVDRQRVDEVTARDLSGRHLEAPYAPAETPGHEPAAGERQHQRHERREQHTTADEGDGRLDLLEVARVERHARHRARLGGPRLRPEHGLGDEPDVLSLEAVEAALGAPRCEGPGHESPVTGIEGLLAGIEEGYEPEVPEVPLAPYGSLLPGEQSQVRIGGLGHLAHRAGDLALGRITGQVVELGLVDAGHQLEVPQAALLEVRLRVGDH